MAGGATRATVILDKQKIAYRTHAYRHAPGAAYGLEAADALGIDPARCFKTLVVDVDGVLTVAVVPVSGSLDLKALASAAGGRRAAMADPVLAERATGYVRGGISPLGQRRQLPVVIDDSALAWETVFVSAGRRGLELEVAPSELVRLTAARLAPVTARD